MEKSIKQKLLSGGLWVVCCKSVGLFSGLTVNAFLARLLSPNDLGIYFLIFSLANFLLLFSLLGMGRSVVRIISESLALNLPGRALDAIKYVLQLGSISSLILVLLLLSGTGQLLFVKLFKSEMISRIIYFPAIWLVLITFQRLIAESFRGLNDIRSASVFNGLISRIIIAMALGYILFQYKKTDIHIVLSVITIAYTVNVILSFSFLMYTLCKLKNKNSGAISRTDLLKTSWPLYLTTIALSGLQQSHLWLLGCYSTKGNVAIYGSVEQIVTLITATLSIVRLVISPLIGRLYTQKKHKEVEKILRMTATIAGGASATILLLVIFWGKYILFYLYGSHYTAGYTALMILSLAHLINVLTGTPGVLLVMASREKFLLLSSIISGLTGILLSFFLVDSMNYIGISIGAGAAIVLQNLLMATYCLKVLSINTFMSFREAINLFHKMKGLLIALVTSQKTPIKVNKSELSEDIKR